jgi:hypothetical protein
VLLTRLVSKDPQRLVLEVRGDGPLGHVRAEADTHGRVRGLVGAQPRRALTARTRIVAGGTAPAPERASARPSAPETLRVVRQMRKQNYESRVSLVEGGVARNVVHFLEQSEQIRSAVMLGVLTRPGRRSWSAWPRPSSSRRCRVADPGAGERGLEARIAHLPSISGIFRARERRTVGAARSRPRRGRGARRSRRASSSTTCDCDSRAFPRGPLCASLGWRARPALLGDDPELEVQCRNYFCGAGIPLPGRGSTHAAVTQEGP